MEGLDLTNTGDSEQPELLIFVTDGDPTRWTNDNGSLGGTGQGTASNIANSLARAIPAADRVKAKNTRNPGCRRGHRPEQLREPQPTMVL